jgi:sigma-B regulation protein RsbU (phosphoserine phosphatase)
VERRTVAWEPDDLLCLWTDGLEDARNAAGEKFGEARILAVVNRLRDGSPDAIVETVLNDAEAFASGPGDDRTMLVLRL